MNENFPIDVSEYDINYFFFTIFQSTKYTQIAANKAYHEAMEAVQLIMTEDSYLSALGVTFRLSYRIKDKYQLFLKMQRKNLSSISQVRDALGMRIIIENYARFPGESDESYDKRGSDICYHLVSELRSVAGWVPAERGFKDYIKNSKENGYQSLHQYIKNKALGTNVEIQVRTEAMHNKASLGEAAHWFYKDKIYRPKLVDTKIYRHAWRSPLQTTARSPEELINMAQQQLLASRVLVFLEDRSTVLNLVKGDTALDATFALHSDLGLTVSTIRIGGRPVPLDYVLQNGDVVTCECSPGVISVSPLWLEIAKSSSALSKIRKYYRENNKHVLVCLGLVHLLSTISLSEGRIQKRFPNGIPSVNKLSEFIKIRTPMSITNFADFLERLGGASLTDSAGLIGSLLDIPAKDLKISSVSLGLFWARMEDENGWGDKSIQKALLLPILKEVLPALALPQIETVWADLIGSKSLRSFDTTTTVTPIPTEALFATEKIDDINSIVTSTTSSSAYSTSTPASDVYTDTEIFESVQKVGNHANYFETSTSEHLLTPTVQTSDSSEQYSLTYSDSDEVARMSERSVRTILTEVTFTAKPWQLHPISFITPGRHSSGFYSKASHDGKKISPLETPVYPTRRPVKKIFVDQISRVRSE